MDSTAASHMAVSDVFSHSSFILVCNNISVVDISTTDILLHTRIKLEWLKTSETAIWEAAVESMVMISRGEKKSKVEMEIIGKAIKDFRKKYRAALRKGTLDSAPDLDVLLLAKELGAGVVAADDGIRVWAERLGLRFLNANSFPKMLKEYLKYYD